MILLFLILLLYGILDTLYLSLSLPHYIHVVNTIHTRNISSFTLGLYGLLAYLTMAITTYILVVRDSKTWQDLLLKAVCLAMAMYGIFNFTNATLFGHEWSTKIIAMDISWGIFVVSSVSFLAWYAKKLI